MPGYGVIPAIRVKDMARALAFYVETLGFEIERGGPEEDNSALARGDARVMLETPQDWYGDEYNEAIRSRSGSPGTIALYIEAPDLEDLHERLRAAGVPILDPLADRPWGQAEFTIEDPDGTWLSFWKATGES